MNILGSSKFHSVLRTGQIAPAVAGVLWALCFPHQAAAQSGLPNRGTITCSSNDGRRAYCNADTRGGARLVRQISGSRCEQGSTWGYDARGVWVDQGCRAEFDFGSGSGNGRDGRSGNAGAITCSSDNGQRRYCDADTRGGVRLTRQINGSGCGPSTWGYDERGVWVDRGCQAEFDLSSGFGDTRDRSDSQARTIGAGTSISVRNNEPINVRRNDGRIFSGVVYQDVIDENGRVAIPRGSSAELIVRDTANRDLAIDLESVVVNGQRYAVITNAYRTDDGRRDGLGTNARTGEFVGGGALVGAIIGAIAGGGKGAAFGAAAGAGAGVGTQLLTRGSAVRIPAESLLTFRLEQPLEMGTVDNGFTRGGHHYHNQNQYQDQNRYQDRNR
jgi:hypothetical protein